MNICDFKREFYISASAYYLNKSWANVIILKVFSSQEHSVICHLKTIFPWNELIVCLQDFFDAEM